MAVSNFPRENDVRLLAGLQQRRYAAAPGKIVRQWVTRIEERHSDVVQVLPVDQVSFERPLQPEIDPEEPVGVRLTLRRDRRLEDVRRHRAQLSHALRRQVVDVDVSEATRFPGLGLSLRLGLELGLVRPPVPVEFCPDRFCAAEQPQQHDQQRGPVDLGHHLLIQLIIRVREESEGLSRFFV